MNVALSFDLFGTLAEVDRSDEPWDAVADSLAEYDIRVPDTWEDAYRQPHCDYDRGREIPLDEHVRLALTQCGIEISEMTARNAVVDAFEGQATRRPGAGEVLAAAISDGPVAICSNCSVPGLAERVLSDIDLSPTASPGPAVVITSVGCGWRKPHPNIFEATADALGVTLSDLIHVGDDPRTDGGASRVGARSILLDECSLEALTVRLREGSL
jgi:FMN phosphatase YigB (HAD superfamily)